MNHSFSLKNGQKFQMHISQNVFTSKFEGYLLGSKFPNTYSLGSCIDTCIMCMKIRLYQLINKIKK